MERSHKAIVAVVFTGLCIWGAVYLRKGEQAATTRIGRTYVAPKTLLGMSDLDPANGIAALTMLQMAHSADPDKADLSSEAAVGMELEGKIAFVHQGNMLRVIDEKGPFVRVVNLSERPKIGARKIWLLEEWLIASPSKAPRARSAAPADPYPTSQR